MGQDDTVTLEKITPRFQFLPIAKVDQSKLHIHEVTPIQLPNSSRLSRSYFVSRPCASSKPCLCE